VIRELESAGHTVLAAPNPLRGVAFDASVITGVVKAIDGPVVLARPHTADEAWHRHPQAGGTGVTRCAQSRRSGCHSLSCDVG
jgi:hypothetical protein